MRLGMGARAQVGRSRTEFVELESGIKVTWREAKETRLSVPAFEARPLRPADSQVLPGHLLECWLIEIRWPFHLGRKAQIKSRIFVLDWMIRQMRRLEAKPRTSGRAQLSIAVLQNDQTRRHAIQSIAASGSGPAHRRRPRSFRGSAGSSLDAQIAV